MRKEPAPLQDVSVGGIGGRITGRKKKEVENGRGRSSIDEPSAILAVNGGARGKKTRANLHGGAGRVAVSEGDNN